MITARGIDRVGGEGGANDLCSTVTQRELGHGFARVVWRTFAHKRQSHAHNADGGASEQGGRHQRGQPVIRHCRQDHAAYLAGVGGHERR